VILSAAPSAPLAVRKKQPRRNKRQEKPLRAFAPFAVSIKNRKDAKKR